MQGRYRINRYMLECKLNPFLRFGGSVSELIDTCWNVNQDDEIEV